MTLRVRTIFFITPIFIGISLFLGVLKYNTEKREIEWGIVEYSSSLGESIAQFVPQDRIKDQNKTIGEFKKLMAWNSDLKAIYLIRKEQKEGDVSRQLLIGTNIPDLDSTSVDNFDLKIGGVNYTLITYSSKDPEIDWGLVIDIRQARNELSRSVVECFIFGFIISLIGILLSLFISGVLSKNLIHLNEGAKKVIDGDYKQVVSSNSSIQEITDLGNTFDTMRNVLADFLERIQRQSIGEKVSSGSLNLPSKDYNAFFWKNREEKWPNFNVNLEFINMSTFAFNRDFGSLFKDEKNKRYAFIGRVESEDNEFHTNISTSLIKILFESSLSRGLTVEEAFFPISEMFKFSQFFCLESLKEETKIYSLNDRGNLEIKNVEFSDNKIFHVHTFGKEVSKILDKVIFYIKHPYTSTLQLFVKQITSESGGVLLLSPKIK